MKLSDSLSCQLQDLVAQQLDHLVHLGTTNPNPNPGIHPHPT